MIRPCTAAVVGAYIPGIAIGMVSGMSLAAMIQTSISGGGLILAAALLVSTDRTSFR